MTDAGIGEEFPTYAAVNSCLIYADIEASNADEFRRKVSAFARELDAWWTAFTDWLGVISVQHFAGLGRRPRRILEYGVHAWSGDKSGYRHTGCGSNEFVVPAEPDTLTSAQLNQCMRLARNSARPAIEWRLIADARSLSVAHEYRRAVLEAGTAAELALTALLEPEVSSGLREGKTLGGLKDLALEWIPHKVPVQLKEDLVDPRNDAMHRARDDVSRDTALKAIAKAAEVVGRAYPLE